MRCRNGLENTYKQAGFPSPSAQTRYPPRATPHFLRAGGFWNSGLESKSGWLYAYRTFWVDPGADWDEEKTAEFLHLGVSRER